MFCLAANYNAPHNNTPMLGVHARGALIRAGVKWLDFCSCPVIVDVELKRIAIGKLLSLRFTPLLFDGSVVRASSIVQAY